MATLVKFVKDNETGEITAIFPQLKYNADLYGKWRVTCYSHIGQHSGADLDWIREQQLATENEYKPLLEELRSIGYKDLRILVSRKQLQQPAML